MANEIFTNAGIITVDGSLDTVVIAGNTYTGVAYTEDQIGQALAEKQTVAAQDVTLSGITISAGKTFVGDAVTMFGNTASVGGAVYHNAGMATIEKSTFADNTAQSNGGAIYSTYDLTISGGTFVANTAGTHGGAIASSGASALLLIFGGVFEGNQASYGGAINSDNNGHVIVDSGLFSGNTAISGGAFAAWDTSSIEVRNSIFRGNIASDKGGAFYMPGQSWIHDCAFETVTDTIYNNGGSMTLGGTIRTAANIYSTNALSFTTGTKLVLDISVYVSPNEKEFLSNYDTAFAASMTIANLYLSVNVAKNQSFGDYRLATSAANFDTEQRISITAGSVSLGTLTVGGSFAVMKNIYSLSLVDDALTLSVTANPIAVVTAGGTVDTVVVDGEIYHGAAYDQSEIDSALANAGLVVVQDVDYTGKRVRVDSGKTLLADRVSFSGATETAEGGAIYSNGSLVLRDVVFATENDTVYSTGAMTLGGTVTTAANLYSSTAITFDPETVLTLNIASFQTANQTAFLSNYDTAFGRSSTLDNLSLTIDVVGNQTPDSYLLATDVSDFAGTITVKAGDEEIGEIGVGDFVEIGGEKFSLSIVKRNLVFGSTTAIVTEAGTATSVTIGDVVYTGTAYAVSEISDAFARYATIVMQGATYGYIGALGGGQTLIADDVSGSGFGGDFALRNSSGVADLSASTFSGNTGSYVIYADGGTTSMKKSVFSGNTTDDGVAIYVSRGTATITGSTFTGNVSENGGAVIISNGTAAITESTFSANTSFGTESAASGGGALRVSGGELLVSDTLFCNN